MLTVLSTDLAPLTTVGNLVRRFLQTCGKGLIGSSLLDEFAWTMALISLVAKVKRYSAFCR